MVEPPTREGQAVTRLAVDLGQWWITVYRRPLGGLPLVTWRALSIETGEVLRGAAVSHARAVLAARAARRRADERRRATGEMYDAAARISRLIREEDDRRHGRGVS